MTQVPAPQIRPDGAGSKWMRKTQTGPGLSTPEVRAVMENFGEEMLGDPNFSDEPNQAYREVTSAGQGLLDLFGRTHIMSEADAIRQARAIARQIPGLRRNPRFANERVIQMPVRTAFYYLRDWLMMSLNRGSRLEAMATEIGILADNVTPNDKSNMPERRFFGLMPGGQAGTGPNP